MFFAAITALVKVPAVQTWLVHRIAAQLSDQMNTTVSIGAVEVKLFSSISLKGLYIEDLKHDTLLYAPELNASISGFDFRKHKFTVTGVDVKNPSIHLCRYKNISGLNIDFLIDYFSSTDTIPDTTVVNWDYKIDRVNLDNAVFTYRDYRWNDTTSTVNFEDLYISGLDLQADDIVPTGDSLLFTISKMNAKEKSGFAIDDLTGKFSIGNEHLAARSLIVKTKQSDVNGDVRLNFNSWDDMNDFIPKVKMESYFTVSKVATEDLKYFSEEVIGLKKVLTFKGDIHGTVDNLKGRKLFIQYTPDCYFKGDLSFKGLPDIDATFIDMMAEDLSLNKKDVETFPEYPFATGEPISLPGNMVALGNVHFKGKFTGFYNDFVAFGTANTAIGFLSSDINFKVGHGKVPASYSGSLITHRFNIGKLLKVFPDVGEITAKMKVKGQSLALAKLEADLAGEISSFDIKGYHYTGLSVDGHFSHRMFNGSLIVSDPNVDLDFKGTLDYSKEKPVLDFTALVKNAKLGLLNLVNDNTANLSTKAELKCTGSKIDDLNGTLHFTNTNYIHVLQGITINNLFIDASTEGVNRNIMLRSDFADGNMSGNFQLSTFFQSASYILGKYIPSITVSKISEFANQTFDYSVTLKETRGVLDVLLPELSIVAGTSIHGSFNTNTENFSASLKSEEIIYRGIRIGGISLNSNTENNSLKLYLMNKELQVNDSLLFNNVLFAGVANRDSADINLSVTNIDTSFSRFNCGFSVKFLSTGYTSVKLVPNEFVVQKQEWSLDPVNYLIFDKSGALVSNLNFKSGDQEVSINGILGYDSTSTLKVRLKDFNSSILNKVLNVYDAEIGGIANGNISIASLLKNPVIQSDLSVKDLSWYGDTLGDAEMVTSWNTPNGKIDVNGFITRGGLKNIAVNGAYIFHNDGDEINFDINLQKTDVKSFSHYLEGLCSDIHGIASGKFKLFGRLSSPQLTGTAHLQKVIFKVDYLNTVYNFSTDVELTENKISFNDVVINDIKGNKATASGSITHDYLSDFYFDVDIATQNTQILNTTIRNNDLYYGNINGTGNISIKGYLDFLKMDIAMRSEKGTTINIPLNNPEEISKGSFITFIKTDTVTDKTEKNVVDLSGLEINMDLDVTTDANIKLIFDDKIGDVIEGNGSGSIKMKINDADGFLMYGNYYIEEGQYTFTLQNVISKPFTIEKGGNISWTGDPYDAEVNINADYSKLRVNLFDLLQDTTTNYRKPIPVILRLKLTEKLFNPVIGFDIEVPNIDAATSSRIQRYISTDEQKFRQAVSLLILRRFSPPDELANKPSTSGAVGSNAYEFLSQQLSNWASQIDENINVGINYNPGNSLTQEELEFALSTSLFNDRVTLEGNVGVAGNNNSTTQSTSNIVGDFSVDVKARKDGKVRLKAFNRSNNNTLLNNFNSQYTQGIGVFYRQEFNTFSELINKLRERRRKTKDATKSGSDIPNK